MEYATATDTAADAGDSKAVELQRVMSAMIIVPLIFMSLRFYCKLGTSRIFGWDDAVLLLSWMLHAAYCVVVIAGTGYGLGSHIETVSPQNLVMSLKLLYVGNWFVIWAISVSKTSFAMTLLSLVVKRWQAWALWFSILSLNVIMGLDAIFQFTQCTPVERTWDLQVPGTCWDTHTVISYSIFAGAWSAFLDFVLAVIPWLLFWDVKMVAPEKIGLIVAMSLGVFSGITACIKTAYLPDLGRWTDLTFSTADLLMWAAAETASIIVGASIPFLRKLLWQVFRKPKSMTSHAKSSVDRWEGRKNSTTVRMGNVTVKTNSYEVQASKADDGSEKSIFGDENGMAKGIIVSQQFAVHVDSDDSRAPSPRTGHW